MEDLWERAEEILAAGKPFVLATIIRTRGSVPREVGAKMVVPPEGQPFGTIGGGCGEGEVLRRAYPVLDQKLSPRIVQVDLTGDFDQDEIQVCGGVMDVALDLWQPEEHREIGAYLGRGHTLSPARGSGHGARSDQRSPTRHKELPVSRPGRKRRRVADSGRLNHSRNSQDIVLIRLFGQTPTVCRIAAGRGPGRRACPKRGLAACFR